jgi:hypothetical protein
MESVSPPRGLSVVPRRARATYTYESAETFMLMILETKNDIENDHKIPKKDRMKGKSLGLF